jgi:hypothetical protein
MPSQAWLVLDPAFEVGAVDPRIFGSFVEHVGRCVYTGTHVLEHDPVLLVMIRDPRAERAVDRSPPHVRTEICASD